MAEIDWFPEVSDKIFNVKDAWNNLDKQKGCELSDYVRPIYEATPPGMSLEIGALRILRKERYFTHRKVSASMPAATIQKSRGSMIYHYNEPRGISIDELKRL